MFSRNKNKNKNTPSTPVEAAKPAPKKGGSGIPSIISADLRVLGNIVSDGLVDIDGIIEGNVRCHTATVRKHGHIKGDVIAESVHVYGKIQGLIKARNVHFFKGCLAEGVIMHESITIEDGAFVDGRFKRTEHLDLDDDSEEEASSAPKEETKKLFGDVPAKFDDSQFKAPMFMTEDTDAEAEDEETTGKKSKAKKRETVMDNLRLISDVS